MNPIEMLRSRLNGSTTQKALAKALKVSPAYLNDVLMGRKEPGEKILKPLGLVRVISYEPRRRNGAP